MIIVWLKALHISALVIWCAGILAFPALFALRPTVGSKPELWQLQRFVREAYRVIVSPAAFVAVVSGTALVFLREVFTAWFAAKLLAVGLLTVIHLRFGHIILHLFEEGAGYRAWRKWASTLLALGVIGAILWLVLEKPPFDETVLPPWLLEPGGLRTLAQFLPEIIRPIP